MKSRSCFRPSPRLHIGDVLWNSEPDSRCQFSHCFWSTLLIFKKMRFGPKRAKTTHPKHPPEGSTFWQDVYVVHSLLCTMTQNLQNTLLSSKNPPQPEIFSALRVGPLNLQNTLFASKKTVTGPQVGTLPH